MTPTQKLEAAESRLESYRRKLKAMQGAGELATERLTGCVMTVAGGAFAGVVWSKFGDGTPGSAKFGDTSFEIDTMIGFACVGAAAFGMAGKHSAELGTFGGGMLAARVAALVGRVLEEHEKKNAAKN
ncbi:MAG TPA: hypothetical protein VFQ35_05950 [Polyangiaceae bacterium]|nr:hypothetical protein [Polyangiaceae bacterium]